jgi:ATP-dependent RNA helicase RhlE
LFSATLAPEINKLAEKLLKNPARVQIGEVSKAAPKIDQQFRRVKQDEKNTTLLDEINARQGTILVFSRTQRRTDRVTKFLTSYGLAVTSIHGGKSQGQRNRAIDGFRDGSFRVMVATDIAARGIDIDHVAHVINMDLPEVPEDYVHRIGRTARAGRSGEAVSFVSPDEQDLWRGIEKLLGKKFQEGQKPKAPVQAKVAMPLPQKQRPQKRFQTQRQPRQPEQGEPVRAFVSRNAVASLPKNIRFKERF